MRAAGRCATREFRLRGTQLGALSLIELQQGGRESGWRPAGWCWTLDKPAAQRRC